MNISSSVILLYGDDTFAIEEHIQTLFGDVEATDDVLMNVDKLEASNITFAEMQSACDALPFLGTARIVLLTNLITKSTKTKDFISELIKYLPHLPPTTLLIIVTDKLRSNSKLLKVIKSMSQGEVHQYLLPEKDNLINWIKNRTKILGGEITQSAAYALADIGTNDTRRLSSEIDKLLAYVNWQEPVRVADVVDLVPSTGQADIFLLVDSVAEGNANKAIAELYRLISAGNRDAIGVFGMIVRQYRLLLQVKEILDSGGSASDIKMMLGLHDFVVGKLIRQSRRYRLSTLEFLYKRIGAMDLAIKTGTDSSLALDIMVAGLTS